MSEVRITIMSGYSSVMNSIQRCLLPFSNSPDFEKVHKAKKKKKVPGKICTQQLIWYVTRILLATFFYNYAI